ncbi:hypothetical protein GGR55DRAFT_495854 [Xylaria sp. FL0064]|nr:hypothetical protein GGR55DRAFT_495854 [Xylaria sp. FL0064]
MFIKNLPSYPCPEASLGREITCSKIRRRKVWWAVGPALYAFENEIEPEIEPLLQKLDLGRADLFIKLYMIGKKPENANPMILLCCTDVAAAKQAEATVRGSGILEKNKGFGLGITDLPLEHPGPIRRLPYVPRPPSPGPSRPLLAPRPNVPTPPPQPSSFLWSPSRPQSLRIVDFESIDKQGDPDNETVAVFALSSRPQMGRRIFTAESSRGSIHFATAGIIISVGGDFYQLTAGHLFELEDDGSDAELPGSPGYCYFDGQSDDDDCDSDQDLEIGSHDSETLTNSESCDEPLPQSSIKSPVSDDKLGFWSLGAEAEPQRYPSSTINYANVTSEPEDTRSYRISDRIPIGYCNRGSRRFPIDYALIALSDSSVEAMGTQLNLIPGHDNLCVTGVSGMSGEIRNIIVVTSSGVTYGELLPGSVAYRSNHSSSFQELFQVKIQENVWKGDCGSPVLDRNSGNLYGHIIMGVAGTNWAYIMPAIDIFRHLRSNTGMQVEIVRRPDREILE